MTHQQDHDDGPQIDPDSKPQYTGVDDPKLLDAARTSLRERYPTLTEDDIENLVGQEANRILNGGTGTDTDYTG